MMPVRIIISVMFLLGFALVLSIFSTLQQVPIFPQISGLHSTAAMNNSKAFLASIFSVHVPSLKHLQKSLDGDIISEVQMLQLRDLLLQMKVASHQDNTSSPTGRLPLQERNERNNTEHGVRCSDLRIAKLASSKPIHNSNCPNNEAWVKVLLDETSSLSSATILSIGCNKGDDFIAEMGDWSGDEIFSVANYRAQLNQKFSAFSARACGHISVPGFKVPKRAIRGFCVEPMPNNYRLIETLMVSLNYLGPVTLIQAAVSSFPGFAMFPNGQSGGESFGLGVTYDAPLVAVRVTTIDEIVSKHNIPSIEFLSIDTEGNDVRAIIGGIRSLAAEKVRYMEFEYHKVGRWAFSDLQDVVDILDQLGFDCYWALNSGGLSRLTGCWHDSYYTDRFWSNVACVQRNLRQTHKKMQELAGHSD